MKFLVDAHLPRALVKLLNDSGHDAVHTRDLSGGNATKDYELNRISIAESRVVISKDADFYNSFTGRKEPYKLLHIPPGTSRTASFWHSLKPIWN
jgi:predicted nuclease of predicted toxin-antitoxin system